MIQVRQKVKEIVEEIEYPEQMSGKQIGEIILGKGQKQENASIHSTYLEIKQLKEYVEKNNQSYNITIENQDGNTKLPFWKKIYRKLLQHIMAPILEQENIFHASVTCSINHLYNNMILTQQFIDEQTGLIRRLEEQIRQQKYSDAVNHEKINELQQRLDKFQA